MNQIEIAAEEDRYIRINRNDPFMGAVVEDRGRPMILRF